MSASTTSFGQAAPIWGAQHPRIASTVRAAVAAMLMVGLLVMSPPAFDPLEPTGAKVGEKQMRRLINGERIERGRVRLGMRERLVNIARGHSVKMADAGYIYHNQKLEKQLPYKNVWFGENVGVGDTVESLHGLFMKSEAHKYNILLKKYDRVGVGLVKSAGRTWITVVFVGG